MKITGLNIQNFLGAKSLNVKIDRPITLFAGRNGSGKSSTQEAVRMALTGEAVRVGLKKDYGLLVTEGAQSGFVEVFTQDDGVYSISLPSGKGTCLADGGALPFVLNAQRFAKLDANERRAFLFGLMGLSAGGAEVKARLLAKDCNDQKVEAIMPLLRSGFDAAHEYAKEQAKEHKTVWRTITGETYGDKKAGTWAAEKPAVDAAALADLKQRLAATDAELAVANQRMGALQADHKRHAEAAQRIAGMRQKASQYARIADKLVRDEAGLKEWEDKVAALKDSVPSQNALPCPDCGVMLVLKDDVLSHAAPMAKGTEDDIAKLPEYEKALRLMQNSVANDRRDLADADAAAKAIAELEAISGIAPGEAEINAARKHLDDIKADRAAITTKLDEQQNAEQQAKQADERTAKALVAHESVLSWINIANALAHDGIPGEMLSEALTPLNERLAESAEVAEWANVTVMQDMQVLAGSRPYALLSESEKWRADAMLAEAISYLSKTKLLVLDRFDVLDMKGREDLIAWLDILANEGEIDTALIFGTLKALPENLPGTISAHWIENGVVAQLKEAV